MNISGYSEQSGGIFNQVKITGKGIINGEVKAKQIQVDGAGTFRRDVNAEEMSVNGICSIDGTVQFTRFRVHGSCDVKGSAVLEELTNKGKCLFDGNVKSDKIHSVGKLVVNGELEAEEFTSKGGFEVKGLLNAQLIDIRIGWDCYAEEIGGEEIRVKHEPLHLLTKANEWVNQLPFVKNSSKDKIWFGIGAGISRDWKWLNSHLSKTLKAKTIEGTTVNLEYTHADVVRGNHVVIGPGCKIEKVEYIDSLEVSPEATVLEKIKL
ncbi:polymer-forming cytoskeletal protein [Lihuaxuella thermophila]|nr:polymer-forming cytoskeletal protein [Lihuaxuella thermophila]